MHIHVFAIDVLPIGELVSSGGGLRSLQIIDGLKQCGAHVTSSVPLGTDGVRQQWDLLSAEDRELAFGNLPGKTYFDIINRVKPDVAVYLWPHAFTYPRSIRHEVVNVFDLNGFQNIEGALARTAFGGAPVSLATLTREYVNKFASADIMLAGSEPQRAYWSGVHDLVKDSFAGLDMVTLPYAPPERPASVAYDIAGPTFFCTGSFLPWNSPEGHLEQLAALIERHGSGRIVVVGRANPVLKHAGKINAGLRKLRAFPFVEVVSGMRYEDFSRMINGRGIGVDLNARTFEREFAVPIRTVTFLSHGVPLITNDYSTLSRQIGRYDAGWQVSTTDSDQFRDTIDEILSPRGHAAAAEKSSNARRLIDAEYRAEDGFRQLTARIEQKLSNRQRLQKSSNGRRSSLAARRSNPPVVLIITDDHENFLQLRVRIPFEAMYRAGVIGGYLIMQDGNIIRSVGAPADIGKIDAVWVQRGPVSSVDFITEAFAGRFVYDIDDNLLVSPSYRRPFSAEWLRIISALLETAAYVTTTTPRLIESLQRNSGVQIEHKSLLAPNVTDIVTPRSFTGAPEALLLASSDSFALTSSKHAFFSGLNRFCQSRDIPILYVGTLANTMKEIRCESHSTGFLDYESYRALLRNENVVAIAPLELRADPVTIDFINCKSDIKMVEFGSAGVPAVYAKAAPYNDSPLEVGPLIDCGDEKSVVDALDMVSDDAERFSRAANESVAAHRLASKVAVSHWSQAIDAARLSVPVPIENIMALRSALIGRYKHLSARVPEEFFDANDYLAMNPDVAEMVAGGETTAYKHFVTAGADAGRLWFPGSSHDAVATITSLRDVVLREPERTDAIEQRLAALREKTRGP